jgi:hypothetical protein
MTELYISNVQYVDVPYICKQKYLIILVCIDLATCIFYQLFLQLFRILLLYCIFVYLPMSPVFPVSPVHPV